MGDNCNPYTLPIIEFIGGETQDLVFNTYIKGTSNPFNLDDCTCNFALLDFVSQSETPLISKAMSLSIDGNNIESIMTARLDSSDTLNLKGKYIYQITLIDSYSNVEIYKGIVYIHNNIDKEFITK